jgi:hypothetical protein
MIAVWHVARQSVAAGTGHRAPIAVAVRRERALDIASPHRRAARRSGARARVRRGVAPEIAGALEGISDAAGAAMPGSRSFAAVLALSVATPPATAAPPSDSRAALTPLARSLIDGEYCAGIVIALIVPDRPPQVLAWGETVRGNHKPPDASTVFEIGSVTKTFTSTLLAEAVIDHQLTLDTPVTALLLPDTQRRTRGCYASPVRRKRCTAFSLSLNDGLARPRRTSSLVCSSITDRMACGSSSSSWMSRSARKRWPVSPVHVIER